MLQTQKKYINFIEDVKKELAVIDTLSNEDFGLENVKKEIADTQIIIPVIGAFSAGKSTLLNSFLSDKYLNVAVTPETALATELRYGLKEEIVAIKEDGSEVRFNIRVDDEKIKEQASEFKYLKCYANQQVIKEIEPMVLVDMPGFESPLDSHNKAILEYIQRGSYFVVLQSVEDGNITASMTRELENLQNFGRNFAFFLSKTNLKSPSEVEQIAEKIQEQLDDYFDIKEQITCIDNNGGRSLRSIISKIDPEELVKKMFVEVLRDKHSQIKQSINMCISGLQGSKAENETKIKELEKGIANLKSEQDMMISDVEARYARNNVNSIVESVGKALSLSVSDIASTFMSQGQEAANNLIKDITMNALSSSVSNSIKDVNKSIIDTLTDGLEFLNKTMANSENSQDWSKALNNTATALSTSAVSAVGGMAASLAAKTGIKATIGVALNASMPIIGTIITAVIMLLPNLLSGLFGNSENKQKEAIQQAILGQVIPQIKSSVREQIPEVFSKQVVTMIETISNDFKEKIEQSTKALKETQEKLDKEKLDTEALIVKYKAIIANIDDLASQSLYK
ncbi:dynamin family protein [uncultured Campylobacter sp.]|uniref:dynamin family protein n=1 Tax=uncultured Campylobacter sp. TaxID=218934 RepID=UPI0025D75275|nr:dynamin family protein [uncultured Campylobacter sp.]